MIPGAEGIAALQAWLDRHPQYTYTVDAYELAPNGDKQTVTLRITYDAATKVETVHVLSGRGTGADLRWAGGDTVDVRGPGLAHLVTVHVPVRTSLLLSPRGNDLRTAILSRTEACYAADASHVETTVDGATITLTDDHPTCTGDYGSSPVATDRLVLDATDGRPIERERLDGTTVVEHWTISDLQTGAPAATSTPKSANP
jgi:hypothetical protein